MGDALIQENEYLSNLIHAEQFVGHIYRGKLDAYQTYIIGRLNYAQISDVVKYSGAVCVGMAAGNNPEMKKSGALCLGILILPQTKTGVLWLGMTGAVSLGMGGVVWVGISTSNNKYNLAIKLTVISIVLSTLLLLTNEFYKPEPNPIDVKIINSINMSNNSNNTNNSDKQRVIPVVPPKDRTSLNEGVDNPKPPIQRPNKDEGK